MTRSRSWSRVMKKECSGAGATLMKTKSSGAGAMFSKRRAPKPEQCHFHDGSAALMETLSIGGGNDCKFDTAPNSDIWTLTYELWHMLWPFLCKLHTLRQNVCQIRWSLWDERWKFNSKKYRRSTRQDKRFFDERFPVGGLGFKLLQIFVYHISKTKNESANTLNTWARFTNHHAGCFLVNESEKNSGID